MVCPGILFNIYFIDGIKIDSKNRSHNVMKSKLEINRIN